ncbi:MAG: ATP-binding protein [Ureaplasma sp.]|nr:ATP-binding protein [Ureaplasma sp.]
MSQNLEFFFQQIIDEAKNKYNNQSMLIQMEQFCSPLLISDHIFYIYVKSKDLYDFLQDINLRKFNEIASKIYQDEIEIKFINNRDEINLIKNEPIKQIKEIYNSKLDKNLTFSTYIVGEYNQRPTGLLKNIIENDNVLFNPIFIFGSTGVGKTHLVNAFAFEYLKNYPERKIRFISAENFSREIYEIISSSQKLEEFKKQNAQYDVFIMEDIQFLSDKNKSNEIFFNIFNNLILEGHLIIITSDRYPEHLNGFTDRMISRFSSGVILQMDNPDPNSIERITQERLRDANLKLTKDAVDLIVRYHYTDIRKLLGSINMILFMNNYQTNNIIDADQVRKILNIEETNVRKNYYNISLNPQSVINSVSKLYSLKASDIIGPSRQANIVNARGMAMYILREKLHIPFEKIGAYFNNRNHSTTMASIKKFSNELKQNKELEAIVESLIKKL